MSFTFLMLPPQSAITLDWADRLRAAMPELNLVVAQDEAAAADAIGEADAVFGTLPPDLLARARKLRWLQAPQAAPPAGYYYKELVEHPVVVTNFRADLRRPYRRAYHGLRARFRARLSLLHPAANAARVEASRPRMPASCTCPDSDGAHRRARRHRRGSGAPRCRLRHDM